MVSFLELIKPNDFFAVCITFLEFRLTDSFVPFLFVYTIAAFYSSLIQNT